MLLYRGQQMALGQKHERVLAELLKAVRSQRSSRLVESQSGHSSSQTASQRAWWESAKAGVYLRHSWPQSSPRVFNEFAPTLADCPITF